MDRRRVEGGLGGEIDPVSNKAALMLGRAVRGALGDGSEIEPDSGILLAKSELEGKEAGSAGCLSSICFASLFTTLSGCRIGMSSERLISTIPLSSSTVTAGSRETYA